MAITIVITIVSPRPATNSPAWEFDPAGFARAVSALRARRSMSTRALGALAGVSQSYVVSLERARSAGSRRATTPTPTPTVEVLARLAAALDVEPGELLAAALRRRGRHVLLVVDDGHRSSLDRAVSAARHLRAAGAVDEWVWAGSAVDGDIGVEHHHRRIDLRRSGPRGAHHYDPRAIRHSLRDELQSFGHEVEGASLGLVFAETSDVLAGLASPGVLLDFEHQWSDTVTAAADRIGAHALVNVCVYDPAVLAALPDPIAAALSLLRSHDESWAAWDDEVVVGDEAAMHLLARLRPADVDAAAWMRDARRLVEELRSAA
jgi:transcriptional regulator with XRE-family HTH domain